MGNQVANATRGSRAHAGTRPAIPAIVHSVLRSPGRPLDGAARGFMEARFGHDFGHVRVHADDRAAASARAVNARAYAVGRDIVFNRGEYQPQSATGLRSLAHELAHVLQQTAGGLGRVPSDLEMGATGDAAEREAERIGGLGWFGPPVLQERTCLRRQSDDQPKKEPPPVIPIPLFDRLDIKPVFPGLPISPPSLEDINKGLFTLRGQDKASAGNVGCAMGWRMRKDGMCCEGTSVDKCCPPYRLTILGRCCPTDQYAKGAECVKFNLPTPTVPAPPPKTPAPVKS